MTEETKGPERVTFSRGYGVCIMGIDGTWRRDCMLNAISDNDANLTVEGSIQGLNLKEFFLLLSSTGLAYRRCELVRVNGTEIDVQFLKGKQGKKRPGGPPKDRRADERQDTPWYAVHCASRGASPLALESPRSPVTVDRCRNGPRDAGAVLPSDIDQQVEGRAEVRMAGLQCRIAGSSGGRRPARTTIGGTRPSLDRMSRSHAMAGSVSFMLARTCSISGRKIRDDRMMAVISNVG